MKAILTDNISSDRVRDIWRSEIAMHLRIKLLSGCLLMFAFAISPSVHAQGCPPISHPGSQELTPYVSKNSEQCPAGAYMKRGQTYDVDFVTTVTGSCDIYIPQGYPPVCTYYGTQTRG